MLHNQRSWLFIKLGSNSILDCVIIKEKHCVLIKEMNYSLTEHASIFSNDRNYGEELFWDTPLLPESVPSELLDTPLLL
jgi:hypothetical protein